jgi:DnaD/phage-associated family protein
VENKGLWISEEIMNTTLTWSEKALLALIQSLSNGRPCTATTNYLADVLKVTPHTVKNCLRNLKEKNIIEVNIFQSRENTKKREIQFLGIPNNCTQYKNCIGGMYKKCTEGGDKNCIGGMYKKCTIDNTDNNTNIKQVENKEKSPTSIFDINQDVLRFYQDNIQPITKSFELERLADDIEHYGADRCIEAIKRAVLRNKRSLGYVESILKSWEVNGYDDRKRADTKGNAGAIDDEWEKQWDKIGIRATGD